MRKEFFSVPAVAVAAILSGCASITDGTSQTIIFNLDPAEARCVAKRDGDGELGSFKGRSASLTVGKDKDDIVVACEAPGREPKTQRVVSKTQTAGVVGGIFLDLGITDMITGAMWKYPTEVTISLDPLPSDSSRAPTPAPGAVVSAPATVAAATPAQKPSGQERFQVSKLAQEMACHASPDPVMTASGTGFESYTVPCSNGDALSIRCDLSNCRALK